MDVDHKIALFVVALVAFVVIFAMCLITYDKHALIPPPIRLKNLEERMEKLEARP